ncbi:MAG: NFACT family protein [Lachnospiraceae bacterium]|nr:NFACT family protein [Lachnospiraceae bacterium]
MALDGITVACLVREWQTKLVGGRIQKIAQPEPDALLLTVKNYDTYRLHLSASASLPLACLIPDNRPSPLTAPNFCMLLRKHLNSARILSVEQPDLERIIRIRIEHLDEMGDVRVKSLIIELMGKHSNIIFCDENDTVIDSIKRVSSLISSVREVLPGRPYFIPQTTEKHSLLAESADALTDAVLSCTGDLRRAIYTSITGVSPVIANELAHRAGFDTLSDVAEVIAGGDPARASLSAVLERLKTDVAGGAFAPTCIQNDGVPAEFAALPLTVFSDYPGNESLPFASMSDLLLYYYQTKEASTRIRQKSAELRRTVQTAIERVAKKLDLQEKQFADTEKKDKFRIYGELLTTYGYSAVSGSKSFTCTNYYDGSETTIPLDETLSVMDNAKRYYERYSKLKRTGEALAGHIEESRAELSHLESVRESLEFAADEADLADIRRELTDCGYLRYHRDRGDLKKAAKKPASRPLHFRTPEGYDIYVGRNNYQNEDLTHKFAAGGDWWFHAKGVPGSHVVLRTAGSGEIPDAVFELAGSLAAYYSANRSQNKVEVDYLLRKNVKKPAGAKPGFVVYYTNYSLVASPSDHSELLVND